MADNDDDKDDSYDQKVKFVSIIAKPLAPKKTTKKIHKLVKKATQAKIVRRGVKEVVKAIRKGERGFCVIGNLLLLIYCIKLHCIALYCIVLYCIANCTTT